MAILVKINQIYAEVQLQDHWSDKEISSILMSEISQFKKNNI